MFKHERRVYHDPFSNNDTAQDPQRNQVNTYHLVC